MSHNLKLERFQRVESGQTTRLKQSEHDLIVFENLCFDEMTTIAAPERMIKLQGKGHQGTGILVKGCKNVRFVGFDVRSTLYGFETIQSSHIEFDQFVCDDVGQEGGCFRSTPGETCGGFKITRSHIRSGFKSKQYGENIYAGDGSNPDAGVITDLTVQHCVMSHSGNESIDIKSNVLNANISENVIANCNLDFNGAITVATEDVPKRSPRFYKLTGNILSNITNDKYAANAFAIGSGLTVIADNVLHAKPGQNIFAVRAFTVFDDANLGVILSNNVWHNVPHHQWLAYSDGGTGAKRMPSIQNDRLHTLRDL